MLYYFILCGFKYIGMNDLMVLEKYGREGLGRYGIKCRKDELV